MEYLYLVTLLLRADPDVRRERRGNLIKTRLLRRFAPRNDTLYDYVLVII